MNEQRNSKRFHLLKIDWLPDTFTAFSYSNTTSLQDTDYYPCFTGGETEFREFEEITEEHTVTGPNKTGKHVLRAARGTILTTRQMPSSWLHSGELVLRRCRGPLSGPSLTHPQVKSGPVFTSACLPDADEHKICLHRSCRRVAKIIT